MAQPPSVIVRTFKPAGELQLYRLDKRAPFHCVRCRQDKMASQVATMGGSWTQTVCEHCYGFLVHEQREKAKKGAKANVGPVQAKQQPSRKVEPAEPYGKSPRPTAKELRQIQRQLPEVDRLLEFFRVAGVCAELVLGGSLWIHGSRTEPLVRIVKKLDGNIRFIGFPVTIEPTIAHVIDEVAVWYVGDKFIRAVEDNTRFDENLRVVLRRHERGFAIMRGDVRLAMIYATHAQIPRREVIHANFLMPGPHWQQVADVLHDAEPELVAEWKHEQEAKVATEAAAATAEAERRRAAARRRIDHLPNDLAPDLIGACLDASLRIRLERQMAYEHPVVLECDIGKLTLLPIARTGTRLLMPFRLSKGTETLKGELVLGDRDPLPLLIGEDVADEDTITAWTCALIGFADATCIELEPVEPTVRREPTRLRLPPPSSASHYGPSTRTLPRKRTWPRHLEPVGPWTRYSSSIVPGHRRRLNDGRTASEEARDRARQVGIILHPHETWVRPHTRGVPDGIEMRFLWHAPTELKLFHT